MGKYRIYKRGGVSLVKRSIFTGSRPVGGGIRIDSFFAELSIVIILFSVSCCAVLQMLAVSGERADYEKAKAAAVSAAQSYCELYSTVGNMEITGNEVFGGEDSMQDLQEMEIPLDSRGKRTDKTAYMTVFISEREQETEYDGLVYGLMYTSDIRIAYRGGEFSASSVCYKPYAAVINVRNGTGEENDNER